jgi:hypothetical protein
VDGAILRPSLNSFLPLRPAAHRWTSHSRT